MATADSLVADVLAYTESTLIPASECLECVNQTLRDMQRRHDWQPMQQSLDVPIPGGTINYAVLPQDFLREVFVYTTDPAQGDPANQLLPIARLVKPQWFSSNDPLGNTDPVFPQVAAPSTLSVVQDLRSYYIWQRTLNIVPTPSTKIVVRLDYSRRLPDLQTGLPTPDQNDLTVWYPDVVRAGALAEAYDFLHEEERAARWVAIYEARLDKALRADNAIAFAGGPAKRGT